MNVVSDVTSFDDVLRDYIKLMITLEHLPTKEAFEHARNYFSSDMRCAEFGENKHTNGGYFV